MKRHPGKKKRSSENLNPKLKGLVCQHGPVVSDVTTIAFVCLRNMKPSENIRPA